MVRLRGSHYDYQFTKDGKRYNGVCEGCTTKREAEAYEKRIKETVTTASKMKDVKVLVANFRDELTGGKAITIETAYDEYLKQPTKRLAKQTQINVNRSYWNDFAAFMQSNYPDVAVLADITGKHAKEYINLLRSSGAFNKTINYSRHGKELNYTKKGEQLSPRTINARHKAIKAVFSRLTADAGLLLNPFDLPLLNNDTASREAFSNDELQLIGDCMTMPFTKPIFTIGLCTGLTLGDICMLRWSEISGNWITNKQRRKTGVPLEIPILPPLETFLNEQRPQTGSLEFVCPELATMYQNNPSGVFYRVKEFLEGIGIKTTTKIKGRSRSVSTKAAHAMRHTFAYLAGVYNVPQPIVQSVLGHMTPRMTELYQQHAQREQKEKFFRQMPNVLGLATRTPSMTGTAALVPSHVMEPEREQLKKLAETLPIITIREILADERCKKALEK